ncbi:MAG: TonB-dependent receptor plug domain-containing protein, partial [Bacteroidota bacterium]
MIRPFLLFFFLSCSCFIAVGQSTLSGTIVDEFGSGITGARIVVVDAQIGAIADEEGNFTLDLPAGSNEVQVSFYGYEMQTVQLNGRTQLTITLISDNVLDEVVVVGYGTQKKSDLVGSVASIDGRDLKALVVGNPTSALQGKMAGIQIENNGGAPGGDANVFVRGVSSLTNSFPLYVIDGTFADNMNFLNPKDIESIEVLKDASSAAIYGSRAANGVVIISTKRGSDDGRTRISFDSRIGVESASKMLDLLNGEEFTRYRNQLETNDGTGFVLPSNLPSTDWQDLSLNSSLIQDYGLSISGGTENAKYFISGNFFDQEGILVGSGFQRLNGRANSQFKLGKLTINQSLSLVQSDLQQNNWFGFDGATAPILAES